MCVTDIYSDFVKSFHIQRGQNRQLINDEIRGREKICLKAYNHHSPLSVITQYRQTTSES